MPSRDHTWPGLTPALGSAKDHTQRGFVKTSHSPRPVPRDAPQAFPLLWAAPGWEAAGGRGRMYLAAGGYSRCHRDAIRMRLMPGSTQELSSAVL